ncbi:MAG: hypothetical protein AAF566_05725 [Pseudomonadota bacterium]
MNALRQAFAALLALLACVGPALAWEAPIRVLWHDGNFESNAQRAHHRRAITDYLDAYEGGLFNVTLVASRRQGALAEHLQGNPFDIVVIDTTERRSIFSQEDLAALQGHYAEGKRALMLDGSLWIRNTIRTEFPGKNGSSGDLMVNQLLALADAGGGTLIGTDHDKYQVAANVALKALLPNAQFTGKTVPSTDGVFFGSTLLAHHAAIRALDILEHWQSVPSQAEAPVGSFSDFLGNTVTLFSLVETADKPGGGPRRPYVSSTIDPGREVTAIDDGTVPQMSQDMAEIQEQTAPQLPANMPTRKGGSQ